ncbi:hypothetical protein LGL55_06000 [Clostridium tagluense]|uniref:hypothetical protein n=1 Tax=Clostridium tagluense TaxID=360422 RepID=UPI001CF19903|nr:hypothetical protein [Clostridium tagluense]MCB2310675.1 hypothetical protein [Clostridium tagluense]MCB2315595.1 hypothetical protein [Clostridium tagluense]MCB2320449.1 hypothetical protein [Clostridium tagluense]MCB2325268.1 hypothetical protein [Clostridium tagluense]MCB2330120.1 hypothetical protein [Clostridium tagluense]
MGYVKGIKWNEDLIESKIYEVMRLLGIDRMPSTAETELILRDSSLSNKIAKTGGFNKWADRLGIEVKRSETQLGHKFEGKAKELIENLGYTTKQMSCKYPFDILVNDKISIDVKSAKVYLSHGSRVHTVGINKKYATCDIYLIFALDEDENIERTFIIPGCDLKVTSMNFGKDSIYNAYLDRWDLLKKYDDFYNNLASVGGA